MIRDKFPNAAAIRAWSDNRVSFKNKLLFWQDESPNFVVEWNFMEPGEGKTALDGHFAVVGGAIWKRVYVAGAVLGVRDTVRAVREFVTNQAVPTTCVEVRVPVAQRKKFGAEDPKDILGISAVYSIKWELGKSPTTQRMPGHGPEVPVGRNLRK